LQIGNSNVLHNDWINLQTPKDQYFGLDLFSSFDFSYCGLTTYCLCVPF